MKYALLVMTILAACGGDDSPAPKDAGSDGSLVDARLVDSGPDAFQSVVTVTCAGTEPTVMTNGFAYDPATITINVGQAIKFVMPAEHNVVPASTGSDPGLRVPFNTTRCLQFNATGTFGYFCGPHGFTGSVTVQ
jgi:plastocyanin